MALNILSRRICSSAVLLISAITLSSAAGAVAQTDQVTYQGVTLRPGDVINFLGGAATTFNFLHYGHAALYLGLNPENNQRTFLDFTTTKGGVTDWILGMGTPQPFYGRLPAETNFLNANATSHTSFDVYRLRGSRTINKSSMFQEAKRISNKEWWGASGDVCSSVITAVLTKGVCESDPCTPVRGFTPDDLTKGDFLRHPDLPTNSSIDILKALREAEKDKTIREVVEPCKSSVVARAAAGEASVGSCESCSTSERQQNLNKLHQIQDREMKRCEIRGLEAQLGYETQRRTDDQDSLFQQRIRQRIVDLKQESASDER